MRNFTLVALGIMGIAAFPAAGSVSVDSNAVRMTASHNIKAVRMRAPHDDARQLTTRSQTGAPVVKAKTVKTFGWNGKAWIADDVCSYTYDAAGNVVEELVKDAEGDFSRIVSVYDANGELTFKETTLSSDGLDFRNNKKTEFEYDPILTDVITKRTDWIWLDEQWIIGNSYKRIINRNEAGDITGVVIAVLFNGIYDPTQRISVTYGEDGVATGISEQILNYDYSTGSYYWEPSVRITDIVWDRTDGQIYDAEDLFLGNNRIKSAHYDEVGDMSLDVSVEYADDSDAYTVTMEGALDAEFVRATTEYTPLEFGGYILKGTTYVMDEEIYSSREEVRYDGWGLMTLSEEYVTEDGRTYGAGSVGEVEYDGDGRPTVYTVSETVVDADTGQESTDYVIRAEYSDYIDVSTGVSSVKKSDEAERYYDLNGVRLAEPAKGRIVVTQSGGKRIF